jgi:uncharacterized protein (TIGR02246 family)
MVSCLVALLVAGQAAASEADERQAVIDAMQSWERAVEAGDYQALEAHYMEDAVYYPHNTAPVIGREAIIERNRRRGRASSVDIIQKVDDVQIHHDWAIYSCLAQVRTGDTGDDAAPHVRVLLVMQKDTDGRWKILRDIDNGTPERF